MRVKVCSILWIWSYVLRPTDRFVESGDDGFLWAHIDSFVLWFRLRQEYERQLREEMVDPWKEGSTEWERQREREADSVL